jgi:tetratricopeptide (TPR) repeat protein
MKKVISILSLVLCVSFVNAQNCPQNENLTRFMTRGKAALKTAEKPEDYKLAANEFLKALEYAPKCPDVYLNLAQCSEQMGKFDPGNYQETINYYNTYLSLSPNAANKQEIQEKIYEIEFLLEKAGGVSLKSLVGKWKFYKGFGSDDDYYDIEIYENNENYYVRYLCDYMLNKVRMLEGRIVIDYKMTGLKPDNVNEGFYITKEDYCNALIEYKDGIISFMTESFISWTIRADDKITDRQSDEMLVSTFGLGQNYTEQINMYQLKITYKMLKGTKICTKYKKCYNGYGTVPKKCYTDCTGDCGKQEVYFVKQ